MIYKSLIGSLEDKIKIENLEAKIAEQEHANTELSAAVDSILTDVLPSIIGA